MNGFEKRAHRIKEKIMRAAMELLRTTEPKRIRIADIAQAAHVSQVTIYNYFGSKEALIREAFKAQIDKPVQDFEAYMNEGHTLKEVVEFIILQEKQIYGSFPPGRMKEILDEDPELAAYLEQQYRDKALPMTVQMIEDAKRSGEIAEDVSVEYVLAYIQLFMNQFEAILEMAGRSGDLERFLESMVRMFFYGICGRSPQ